MSTRQVMAPLRKAEVVADIERRILAGEFEPGERLPSERHLCGEYGVSRPVIREALAGLVERGLVDIHAGRGTFVREVAVDDLSQQLTRAATRTGITARDLVDARVMLECTAAELAARRAPHDADKVLDALEMHERAVALDERVNTDLAFHEAIAAASGNPVIALMFGSIRGQVHALMLRSHSDRKVRQLGDPIHREIADAIAAGHAKKARQAMAKHLELALELFGDDLDRPLAEVLESRGLDAGKRLGTVGSDQ